jgi:hypothetical protein
MCRSTYDLPALYISKTNTELICLLQSDEAAVAPSHYFDVVEVCPLIFAFLYSPSVVMTPTDQHIGHS